MLFLNKFRHRLFRYLSKRNIVVAIILGVLLTWGLIHSCSQEEFKRKRFYTIGRDNTWYPFHLGSKERNLIGFTNDLMFAIGKESKLNWTWIETNPSTLEEGLDYERYDAIISTMRPNFMNVDQYIFSDLFFQLGLVLVVPQNSTASSLKDLQGKTIGISYSSYSIFKNIREGGPHLYDIQLITYDKINQAVESLEKGQLDGIITHVISAYALTRSLNQENLKVVTAPLTDEGLRLVGLRNEESKILIKDFDQALKKIKENGKYSQLITKWDLIDPTSQFLDNDQNPNIKIEK